MNPLFFRVSTVQQKDPNLASTYPPSPEVANQVDLFGSPLLARISVEAHDPSAVPPEFRTRQQLSQVLSATIYSSVREKSATRIRFAPAMKVSAFTL